MPYFDQKCSCSWYDLYGQMSNCRRHSTDLFLGCLVSSTLLWQPVSFRGFLTSGFAESLKYVQVQLKSYVQQWYTWPLVLFFPKPVLLQIGWQQRGNDVIELQKLTGRCSGAFIFCRGSSGHIEKIAKKQAGAEALVFTFTAVNAVHSRAIGS